MQVLSISNLAFQIKLLFYSKSCIYLIQNQIFSAQRKLQRKSSSDLSFDKHYDYRQIKVLYTYDLLTAVFAQLMLSTYRKNSLESWKAA